MFNLRSSEVYWNEMEESEMYKDLPRDLQKQVKEFLETNQFCKAKAVHDAWMAERELITRRRVNACRVQ